MSDDNVGGYVSQIDYDTLKIEYESVLEENKSLLEDRDIISNEIQSLHQANNSLKYEIDIFENKFNELKEEKKRLTAENEQLYKEKSQSVMNGDMKQNKGTLKRQLSVEEQISGAVTSEEKDGMISGLDEQVAKLAHECEQYKALIRILEEERQSVKTCGQSTDDRNNDKRYGDKEHNECCPDCVLFQAQLEALEGEMNDQLEKRGHKYDQMVNYYDGVLRERAADIDEYQMKLSELHEENDKIRKILKNAVGTQERATSEQVKKFRRVSRVSTISGTAQLPKDLNKDQLITQLTNELSVANVRITNLEDKLSDSDTRFKQQIDYLEDQKDKLEQSRTEILAEIQVKLEDREFLRQLFHSKKDTDPSLFKQILADAGQSSLMSSEQEEDLEFRIKQKSEENRVLERELSEAYEERQKLERDIKKEKATNKQLSQYKYAKDSLDQIVNEYCSGIVFTKKPEVFQFEDDNLNSLVTTLYNDQTKIKKICEDNRRLKEDLEKQNNEQVFLKIETLEKQVANLKETISENFQEKIKNKSRIQDLEDELRKTQYEYSDKCELYQALEDEKQKNREKLDEADTRNADLEDELHQRKKELEEELRKQKGESNRKILLTTQIWIQKNKFKQLEKKFNETLSNNSILSEENQILKDKLETTNCEMAEQVKTSRRISSILKPGGNIAIGSKDAIIQDLKSSLQRQKTYANKLEDRIESYQNKTRELENSLRETTEERDSMKHDLEASFSRMDSTNNISFGERSDSGTHTPFSMEMFDPTKKLTSLDFTDDDDNEIREAYNKLLEEYEERMAENEDLQQKNKRLSIDLDREKTYSENIEENYENLLIKNRVLQDQLDGHIPRNFERSLSTIKEEVEEGLYSGTLTEEQLHELRERLEKLQEELDREKIYCQHLEEQNEELRISLQRNGSRMSDVENCDILVKYSETKQQLDERLNELKEAQRRLDEFNRIIEEYEANEAKYRDDINNVSDQLESSLYESSENELIIKALKIENADLQVQVRDLMDEQVSLTDKNIILQETLANNNDTHEKKLQSVNNDHFEIVESLQKDVNKWKDTSQDLQSAIEKNLKDYKAIKEELAFSKTDNEHLLQEKKECAINIHRKDEQLESLLTTLKESDCHSRDLKDKLKIISELEEQIMAKDETIKSLEDKLIELSEKLAELKKLIKYNEESYQKTHTDHNAIVESLQSDITLWKNKYEELQRTTDISTQELEVINERLISSNCQVEQLLQEKQDTAMILQEKIKELENVVQKIEESDIDTKELTEKLKRISELENQGASNDEKIRELEVQLSQLSKKSKDLKEVIEKERIMNNKNRELMDNMQNEVRQSRILRQKSISDQVTAEGRCRNIEIQCEERIKQERQMNEKNRDLMNFMQSEVRRAKADRAILQTELIDSKKNVGELEIQLSDEILQNEKLAAKIVELEENNEVANLHSAIDSLQSAMIEMEERDAQMIKTIEQKMKENAVIEDEIMKLQNTIEELNQKHQIAMDDKDNTIATLELALSEELERADLMESFKNRVMSESCLQTCPEMNDEEIQMTVLCHDEEVQSDWKSISSADQYVQVTADKTDKETCVDITFSEMQCQIGAVINENTQQTDLTIKELVHTEETINLLSQELEHQQRQSSYSLKELTLIKADLIGELKQVKDTVSDLEINVTEKENIINDLEEKLSQKTSHECELVSELTSVQEQLQNIHRNSLELNTHQQTLEQKIAQLSMSNDAMQTELDIQIEARHEIDTVIEDKEKSYLELADKYNMEKIEKEEAKSAITTLQEGHKQLKETLETTQNELELEKKFCENIQKTLTDYQEETNEVISSLNIEIRRKLLEQSYAHVLSSDSETDDNVSTLPKPIRKIDSSDFNKTLNETEHLVKALIKANYKLCKELERLTNEKDKRSHQDHLEFEKMTNIIKDLSSEKERLAALTKALELELIERDVSFETAHDEVIQLRREIENQKLQSLKKSPCDQGTLTELHNLFYRCFMVIPSDPARDLLHMFVSQYKENLCSNCYARITTLGSNPCTPRIGGGSPNKSVIYSDIMLQTDNALFKAGTDSAYSSSVSIQTETREQNVERLKLKTQQLTNDLTDSKKSERELELALQYQLKTFGDLQKKYAKSQKLEKELQEKISNFRFNEDDMHKIIEDQNDKYAKLLECYKGLHSELQKRTELEEHLQNEIQDIRLTKQLPTPRSSTPDNLTDTPPSNECSLYLSPIVNKSVHSKVFCDREIDTMSPLIITWADNSTQTDIFQSLGKSNEDSTQEELLAQIKFFTDKLCSALHLNKEHNALPILIRAIENKVEELTKEKQTLEGEVKKEMLRVHEELQQARDQLSKTEESNIDLEEELNRVLDYQEQERVEMQHRMRSIAGQVKAELEKAKQDKKMAEETLNTSLEKLCEETNLMNEHHEQSLLQLRQERDSLKRKLDEAYNTSKQEQDRLLNERNELERSFFDYKIKSVSEKEGLIDSQTRNLEMLERLKKEYETRDKQVDDIRQQCAENIEKLKHELEEIKLQEKDKNLEIERLKNKIHEYCNREVDAKEKLDTNQRIIGALKRDVLETRDRLESLAGIELEKREADENLEKLTLANKILSEKVDFLEGTKITLEAEAGELRNAIENARHSLTNAQKMNTESYKNPAIAAVAHLWMQERDEHRKLHQEVCSLSKELEDVKIENVELEESFRSVNEDLSNRLNTSDAERVQLKTKLQSLQENKINIEYEVERVKDNLNKSNQQLEIAASDRTGLQSIINQQSQEKDRLLDDLNQSFKEKAQKTKELENCLTELATSRDELHAVKDELVKNRKEEEKLRESLKRARVELDDLEDNVERMKQETDTANINQSRLLDLEEELTVTQKKNTSLSRQVKMLQEERMRIEETSQLNNEKLEKDISEILDAFEEYKAKTGSAPEKVQELKQGMTALQETLHQIMNTNSDLSKSNAKLSQDITNLRNENEILSREREEYKHQLDNSMLDLSKDSVTDVLTQNMSLKEQLESSHKKIQRCEKLEHDNVILKNKLRKMRDMLRDKEDQLVNLNETVESKDDCDRENQSLRRQVSVLKQKLDKNKEANIMLKDKIRELNTSDRFLASTPNQSRSFSKEQELTDELDTVKKELENLKRCRNNLAADSRISFTPSQMSTSVLSASERCKTLELELSDMKDRYQILQTTHEAEQNKSHELSDALRNSIRILKSYIDRSGETKGTRMYELQNQLDEQRSQLISMSEQFSGLDVSQALTGSLSQFQTDHELESLASGSTVCLEPTDSQLI